MTNSATAAVTPQRPRAWVVDIAMLLAGLGLGAVLALHIATRSHNYTTGNSITEAGRVSGLVGTYTALLVVILAARIPWLEREVGQDRLIKWHRLTGPYAIWLIVAHVALITLGYAMNADVPVLTQLWNIITTMPEMVKGAIGFLLFALIGLMSYRRIRRLMQYEFWWISHLTVYIGILLAYSHQVALGQAFMNQPTAAITWQALTFGSLAAVLVFRWIVPVANSWVRDFRVMKVVPESQDTVSIYIGGRDLHKLNAAGGQFFMFRFLTSKLWWHAHPFSISAAPNGAFLRITVRDLGNTSRALMNIATGTRIVAEGPYGVFTASHRRTNSVLLIAGGVGITPIRAVLEDLPAEIQVDLLYRVHDRSALVLARELDDIAAQRTNTRVRFLIGARRDHPIDAHSIVRMVPHAAHCDWYLCGPRSLVEAAKASAEVLGVPIDRIHSEEFAFLP